MQHKVNFKPSLTGLNLEFSFLEDQLPYQGSRASLPYYLHIDGGRIVGFIPFQRVFVLCEMQPHCVFELMSLSPFPTKVTTTP